MAKGHLKVLESAGNWRRRRLGSDSDRVGDVPSAPVKSSLARLEMEVTKESAGYSCGPVIKSLDEHTKVGVQVGSIAAMIISQRHVPTSTFGFEVDSLEALANREIDAAAVTPTIASYFNQTRRDNAVRILDRDESETNLNWNVAVGMVRPDQKLREAIDAALERLHGDGTIDRIYGRYGVVLQSPR